MSPVFESARRLLPWPALWLAAALLSCQAPEGPSGGAKPAEAEVGSALVTPATGDLGGGTLVTVRGEGFRPDAQVAFGGVLAAEVRLVDAQTLLATTAEAPPGAVGEPVDPTLTTPISNT